MSDSSQSVFYASPLCKQNQNSLHFNCSLDLCKRTRFQTAMLAEGIHVCIVSLTSSSTFMRLKERTAALGQRLKISASSEAVPQAARKCFDFSSFFSFLFSSVLLY